jgi:hypothetical protein
MTQILNKQTNIVRIKWKLYFNLKNYIMQMFIKCKNNQMFNINIYCNELKYCIKDRRIILLLQLIAI